MTGGNDKINIVRPILQKAERHAQISAVGTAFDVLLSPGIVLHITRDINDLSRYGAAIDFLFGSCGTLSVGTVLLVFFAMLAQKQR